MICSTNDLGINKVMSHGAVLVVEYALEWRFNSDQSNATWQRYSDYVHQDIPARQLQDQQSEYDLSVNNPISTRYQMSRLSPPVHEAPGDVDTSTPVRKRKRGNSEADDDVRQIGQIENPQIGQIKNVKNVKFKMTEVVKLKVDKFLVLEFLKLVV